MSAHMNQIGQNTLIYIDMPEESSRNIIRIQKRTEPINLRNASLMKIHEISQNPVQQKKKVEHLYVLPENQIYECKDGQCTRRASGEDQSEITSQDVSLFLSSPLDIDHSKLYISDFVLDGLENEFRDS